MRVKEAVFSKSFTKGLPGYSSIKASFGLTVEVTEGETLNRKAIWDEINKEILENLTLEEDWLEGTEDREKRLNYNNFRKGTV